MLIYFKLFKKFDFIKNNIKIVIINRFYKSIIINKLYKLKKFKNQNNLV